LQVTGGVFHGHITFEVNIEWETWEFIFGIHEHCFMNVHVFDGNWPYSVFGFASSGRVGLSSCMNLVTWKMVEGNFDASNIFLDFLVFVILVFALCGGCISWWFFSPNASACYFGVLGCEGQCVFK
jgi:hypothetical protein